MNDVYLAAFIGLLSTMALILYPCSIEAVRSGSGRAAALGVLLASPTLVLLTGLLAERRSLSQLVTPDGSWALMFGNLVLALGVYHAVNCLRQLRLPSGRYLRISAYLSGGLGLAAGLVFHWWDGNAYRADGFGHLVDTATKLAHDYFTVAFVVATLCNLVLVVLGAQSKPITKVRPPARLTLRFLLAKPTTKWMVGARLAAFVMVWAGFYVRDGIAMLDPEVLHGGAAAPAALPFAAFVAIMASLTIGYAVLVMLDALRTTP